MPALARILVLVREPHEARRLVEQVRQRGYYGFSATTVAEGTRLARQLLTDLVIVDAFLGDGEGCDFADMLKRTPETAHIPVIMLADKFDGTLRRRSLSVGVDDFIVRPIEDDVLFARLVPLVRLSTMHGELQRRTITARTFRTDVDLRNIRRSNDGEARVLLVASSLDAKGEIEPLLRSAYEVTSVENPYAANELLLKNRFDAVILATDKDSRDDHFSLCTHIRDNPRLYNLPVVMVSEQDAVTDIALAHRVGASELVWRPLHPDDFRVRLVTLVRRQRLRQNIRKAFEATRSAETTDPVTGLYRSEFIRVHLTRLVFEASKWDKHLSIGLFTVKNVSSLDSQHGAKAAADLVRQVAQMILRLVRVEDVVARLDADTFCVVIPDTPLEQAQIALHRIAGVLLYTDFAVKGAERPVNLWLQVGSAALSPNDRAETLVARARTSIL